MLLNKEQLTQSLLQLVQGDYDLLNDKEFQHYEDYVNSQMNELM